MKSEDAVIVWTPASQSTADDPRRGQVRVLTANQNDNQLLMAKGACDAGWQEMKEEDRQAKLTELMKDLVEEHRIDPATVYQEFAKIDGWKL